MPRTFYEPNPSVPDAFKEAAETVRVHLCALRGGAPFLSSADAMQLMRWFEGGVSTTAILLALERAAEARRRRRSKVPLRLSHANRHLGRPTTSAPLPPLAADDSYDGPFAPILLVLAHTPSPATDELARGLASVQGVGEPAVTRALDHVHRFLDRTWQELGEEGQQTLIETARGQLGDLLDAVDETTAAALLDETAHDVHRSRWPILSVATLWDCVETA
ncbi:MAG: hypothetical protein AAGA48_22125 [Myxococcota bacterium]